MGTQNHRVFREVTEEKNPPKDSEFELSLFGPGYGECIVLHIGGGKWVIVDSFCGSNSTPRAIRYLEEVGVNPKESVCLIVATHWHDDHIRGMADLVKTCRKANFCCSSALLKKEFLALQQP